MPIRLARPLLFVGAALALSACAGMPMFGGNPERPKGPGSATDSLRASPCACMELPNRAPDDGLLDELRRAGSRG